jgi:hypothetical protein
MFALPFMYSEPRDLLGVARKAFEAAIDIQERLVVDLGARAPHRRALSRSYTDLSWLLNAIRDFAKSAEAQQQAEELLLPLTEQEPQNAEYRSGLALVFSNRAARLRMSGNVMESFPVSRAAIVHHKAAAQLNPSHARYLTALRTEYTYLAETFLLAQMHRETAQTIDELVGEFPDDSIVRRTAGQHLARCVAVAEADETLVAEEREALAQNYANRAIEHLRILADRNRDKSAAVLAFLKRDKALEAIRQHAEFQKLLTETSVLPLPPSARPHS